LGVLENLFYSGTQFSIMDYLSSGFSKVNSSHDPGVFISCLQTLSSLPYFQGYKKKSFQLLEIKEDSKILEIGCGLGQDAIALSQLMGNKGVLVAFDSSRKMIEAARKGDNETAPIQFCLADGCRLPFGDGVFDGARADRVFQHILDPRNAFAEMVRTVRDNGRVVVYEPDWGTFIISPGEKEICSTMAQIFGDTFPSGWIGRKLPSFFREEGLEDIQINPETFFTENLNLAIQIFDLVKNAQRALDMGYVSESQADDWLDGLREADKKGRFFCSYTGFLVSGKKP